MFESARRAVSVPFPLRIAIISLSCTVIIGAAASCSRRENSAVVQFSLQHEAAGAPSEEGFAVRDFRFYVHHLELLTHDNEVHALEMSPVSSWQGGGVTLIDLVGASEADGNNVVQGTIESDVREFVGIRFSVGVPFELNHANPLTAAAPLNLGELFWSWQTGYKFMRVDLADARGEWSFHLGSTGCASASAVRAPQEPCAQPNIMRVELLGFDPLREPIRVRADVFAQSMREHGPGACTGNYGYDPACADILAKTGLQLDSGVCREDLCKDQRMFAAH